MDARQIRAHERAISELRELFWGRFTGEEVEILYHLNDSVKQNTVRYVFSSDPRDVRSAIAKHRPNWETIKKKRRLLPKKARQGLRSGVVETTSRQFACEPCDSSWWRNVPVRKQVSKCYKCNTRYDPIPREKEWGWAEFHCQSCGHDFNGFCQMGVESPCYKCGETVTPQNILPPKKRETKRVSRQTHSCRGCQQNFQGGTTNVYSHGVYVAGGAHIYAAQHLCAHPSTRRQNNLPNVLHASLPHESSGSTVDTFLPQEDLNMKNYEVYDRISHLGSIDEEREDDDSDDENKANGEQ